MLARRGNDRNMLSSIVGDFAGMPVLMKRLALVQFFSWSALLIMWINTTPIVAQYHYGATDAASAAYQDASNWVGELERKSTRLNSSDECACRMPSSA